LREAPEAWLPRKKQRRKRPEYDCVGNDLFDTIHGGIF
jgi:hypothetical protein